ncbi:MAG: spermidine/putrescine ABC transporter substrate-binding protein [Candidatus Cloacimonetes bacterium]|nr:spermidine/putrescine ABC transporter substrate-binding protein [Candidatus Cloacimonadota bacterium]
MKRIMIALITMALLLSVFASCSRKSGQVLYIFNWTDYIDPDLVKEFEELHNCRIIYSTYGSNEDMLTKIVSSRESFDLVFPSGDHVSIMKEKGLLEPLDRSKLSNYANINPLVLKKAGAFDPGNEYGVPYFWGLTGLIYNKTHVPESLIAPQSWDLIGNSFFSGKNKITMLDDAREVVGAALIYNGYGVNDTSAEAMAATDRTLMAWDRNITQFDSDSYKNEVADGTTWLAQAYNGDALQQMEMHEHIGFYLPKEGASLWVDSIVMLKTSRNKELAYKFIDFLLQTENALRNAEYTQFATPVLTAFELLDEEIRENRLIYPEDAYLDKCYAIEALGDRVRVIDALFEKIKLN